LGNVKKNYCLIPYIKATFVIIFRMVVIWDFSNNSSGLSKKQMFLDFPHKQLIHLQKEKGMKKALFVLLALLFAVSAFAQNSVWFEDSFDAAKAEAEKLGKLLIVDFYSDG